MLQAVKAMHFIQPSKIQEIALPFLLGDTPSNVIAQAQSGTGKTAAFVLTMLSHVDTSIATPQCICLAPTLELAKQIGEVVSKMSRYMPDVKLYYALKGKLVDVRRPITEHIIIGTPGKVLDCILKYKVCPTLV